MRYEDPMIGFVVRRIGLTLPMALLVSVFIFGLVHFGPGDPAVRAAGGLDAGADAIIRMRELLGLNRPWYVQYWEWLGQALRGDFGTSLFGPVSVSETVLSRLPVTLSLTGAAVIVALMVAIPAGLAAGMRAGTMTDRVITSLASVGIATPNFFMGLLLVLLFAHTLGWLPATGYVPFSVSPTGWARTMILPAIALGTTMASELARHLRASLRDVLSEEYIRTAVAKGLTRRKILWKHALKNAAIPVVTVLGLQVRNLLGGAVIIEQIFNLRGIGSLAVSAVFGRDYPMIQGFVATTVVIVLLVNFFVDLIYGYLNPKVRVTS